MLDFRPLSLILGLLVLHSFVALISSAGPGTRTGWTWKTLQAYLTEKKGLSMTNAVLNALHKAGYDKPGSNKKIMIQSTHSSVLKKIFKEKSKYERVYKIDESIHDALDLAVEDIKSFADSVVIGKASVILLTSAFLVNYTNTITTLQSFNLSVYVETFSNEFVSQAWDYYSDAFVEINSFVKGAKVDGIITADKFKNAYMSPVEPGRLLRQISQAYLPPLVR